MSPNNVSIKQIALINDEIIFYVQVQGQLSLLCGGLLTFGLKKYPYSEFELMTEELLMSDSSIKVKLCYNSSMIRGYLCGACFL